MKARSLRRRVTPARRTGTPAGMRRGSDPCGLRAVSLSDCSEPAKAAAAACCGSVPAVIFCKSQR